MDDIRLEKRTIQERLIIAKTLIETALSDLPNVEPRKGKWKEVQVVIGRDGCFTTKEYECETCGYRQLRHENFCGRCGADMREENDDES